MEHFITDHFLLSNDTAKALYHNYAAKMPILDYHCHISPKEIYEDRRFENLTQLWLGGDHYKWRIMRSHGIEERYITGDAPDKEKFEKFAEALSYCIGNPMYHWCHLELRNYFGYDGVLNAKTADHVWQIALDKLKGPSFSARGLITQSRVEMVGTTDDPIDDLQYHRLLANSDFNVKVYPTFRPDAALNLHKPAFAEYIGKLSKVCEMPITSAEDVAKALSKRIAFFVENGCRASDHGLDYVMYREGSYDEINRAFTRAMAGESVTLEEREMYQTYLLVHCAREYHRYGLVMQLHFSCMRNPNTSAYHSLGPDTGFDCIAVTDSCQALGRVLDALQVSGQLPKTILYSLNPADDAWIGTLIGAFQGDGVRGKIQHGSAWWFNDHKVGMINQMTSLANLGILGNFVGMLTDSRSFLSYARHEYFRRILCQLIGTWVENGEYPCDMDTLGMMVENICYYNAKAYFNL